MADMALAAFTMIDDFLANPDELRESAPGLGYNRSSARENYPGITSDRPIAIKALDDFVSRAIGTPVFAARGTLHGHCRITLRVDRGRRGVHVDPAFYSGILYLSRPEHARGGTDFYRHRRTNLDKPPTTPEGVFRAGYSDLNLLIENVVNKYTHRPSALQKTFTAPMR
ncbi:DUF6445 family protein [Brevundimonas sp.]|uniref:DUF6445 family protein n=1 Tax=Brevundimonas sp. TaxID=1871086 RepID=UPI003569FBC1